MPLCLRSDDSDCGHNSSDTTNDSGDPRHLSACVWDHKPVLRYAWPFYVCKRGCMLYAKGTPEKSDACSLAAIPSPCIVTFWAEEEGDCAVRGRLR